MTTKKEEQKKSKIEAKRRLRIEVGKRIAQARKALGLKQAECAKQAGWKNQIWHKIESGLIAPSLDRIIIITKILRTHYPFLLEGDDNFSFVLRNGSKEGAVEFDRKYSVLQCWVWVVEWQEAGKTIFRYSDAIKSETRQKKQLPNQASIETIALIMQGDSMESGSFGTASFRDGDVLYFEPVDEPPKPGSYVIARKENSAAAVFRKLVVDCGQMYLKPNNPQYPVIPVTDDMRIFGVLFGSFSKAT